MNLHAPPCMRPSGKEWARALAASVQAERLALISSFREETGYAAGDAALLLDAALQFMQGLVSAPRPEARRWRPGCAPFIARVPWGRVLITIPVNAALPLGIILPAAFAHAGNSVAVCGNRPLGGTTGILSGIFRECQVPATWMEEGGRAAVAGMIEGRGVDLVYSVGGSRHFPAFAQQCAEAGIDLVFEGEGGGCAVLDILEPGMFKAAVSSIVESKYRWRGQMCSAPLVAYVPESRLAEFTGFLQEATRRPHWAGQAPVRLGEAAIRHIEEIERLNGLPGQSWQRPLERVAALGPVPEGDVFASDVFGPVFFYRTYACREALEAELSRSPYGLQTSVYSQDEEFVGAVIRASRVSRVCVNRMPALQDPLRPWGGYRKSGRSDVSTFIDKAYRRVLVESD